MSDRPTPGHGQKNDLGYEQPPATGACGPSPDVTSVLHELSTVEAHALALADDPDHPWSLSREQVEALALYVDSGMALPEGPRPSIPMRLVGPLHEAHALLRKAIAPKAAGPEGEAPNQDPVDWQARSQVLEEAIASALTSLGTGPMKDGYAYAILDEALAVLGLPDEEGERETHQEQDADGRTYTVRDSGYGAAPPPRGAAREGADGVLVQRTVLDGYFATGDYEAFCFDKHEGPEEHDAATEHFLESDDPEVFDRHDACRVYPNALLPDSDDCFGRWTITVAFEPKAAGPSSRSEAEAISKDVQSVRDVTGEGER